MNLHPTGLKRIFVFTLPPVGVYRLFIEFSNSAEYNKGYILSFFLFYAIFEKFFLSTSRDRDTQAS